MLAYYAGKLPAVEINNTFYRLPKTSVLENWLSQVPGDFAFAIKASWRIIHLKRLKDCSEETAYLLKTTGVLGSQLGALLFQLPPYLRCDIPLLKAFLDLLQPQVPAVFEFRHEPWFDEGVLTLLKAQNRPLVWVDQDDQALGELPVTANWPYLRLRRAGYSAKDLKARQVRLAEHAFQRALVFFKHEQEGAGPDLATAFLAGLAL